MFKTFESSLNLINDTFLIAKLGSISTITGFPIVPIMGIMISPISTLDLSLIFLKSASQIREQSVKSIFPPVTFLDVTRGYPVSKYCGESCVPSRTSQTTPSKFLFHLNGLRMVSPNISINRALIRSSSAESCC